MSVKFDKIYEELWNLDQKNHGASVSARNEDGDWVDPNADILLDEQQEAAGKMKDAAPNPLFYKVNRDIFKIETYDSFIQLLNNYVMNPLKKEDTIGSNKQEDEEVGRFLNEIMKTEVAKQALLFINQNLDKTCIKKIFTFLNRPVKSCLENEDFMRYIKLIWFDIYTNHYNGNSVPSCSGFEHVFVGEGKVDSNGLNGYHNWIKYYLDEVGDRVDFRGCNYDVSFQKEGIHNPYVATLQMTWFLKDIWGKVIDRKFKDKGGFFVGISPECQIIMGALLLIENISGLFTDTDRPIEINGECYDLILYRESNKKNNDGMRIRSFYPRYKRPADLTKIRKHYKILVKKGNMKVVSAYLNPRNSDRGRGWIEVHNHTTHYISLNDWKLIDDQGNKWQLNGGLSANKTRRLMVYKSKFSLKSSGGFEIKNREGQVVFKVNYKDIRKGKVLYF